MIDFVYTNEKPYTFGTMGRTYLHISDICNLDHNATVKCSDCLYVGCLICKGVMRNGNMFPNLESITCDHK